MTFGDPCPGGCHGSVTGGCPLCNQRNFYTIGDPPSGTDPQWPVRYAVSPPQTYQPIPEPGPTQRERIVVQLLAGLIGAGMDDCAAVNKAFDLADIVMKRLNAL